MKAAAIIIFVILGSFFLATVGREKGGLSALPTVGEYSACVMAEKFVSDRLKSPSTAEFAPCREPDTVATHIDDTWTVRSWVDAQNTFGAMLRADTTVVITYNADTEKWTLKDFQMENR